MSDHGRVHDWPEMHWNIAAFVCLCILFVAALLADYHVLRTLTAICAAAGAVAYVLLLTWYCSRAPKNPAPDG